MHTPSLAEECSGGGQGRFAGRGRRVRTGDAHASARGGQMGRAIGERVRDVDGFFGLSGNARTADVIIENFVT